MPIYKEANPAVFTIVTFPFLFGVMFGDVLHGLALFILSSLLCFSKVETGSMMADVYKARYLLLLMGFFSFYCGLIYNDMTSVPLNVFGDSCYELDTDGIYSLKDDCVY